MNFIVQQYDPIDEAIELFARHNATPPAQRDNTEEELTQLAVQKIRRHMDESRQDG